MRRKGSAVGDADMNLKANTRMMRGSRDYLGSDDEFHSEYLDTNDPLYDSEVDEMEYLNEMLMSQNDTKINFRVSEKHADRLQQGYGTPGRGLWDYTRNLYLCSLLSEQQCPVAEFMAFGTTAIRDFFTTKDVEAVIAALKDLNAPTLHDIFILKAVRMVLDRSDEMQECVGSMLTALHDSKFVSEAHLIRAFEKLIQSVEDLSLDVPDAADRILNFMQSSSQTRHMKAYIMRLPEVFLRKLSPALGEARERTDQMQRLRTFKKNVTEFLQEGDRGEGGDFFLCSTGREAASISATFLQENEPESNLRHEFVRLVLRTALTKSQLGKEVASSALSFLSAMQILNLQDVIIGFARHIGQIEDLQLDCPEAPRLTSKFIARAIVDDVLPPAFVGDFYKLHIGGRDGMETLARVKRWLVSQHITPDGRRMKETQKSHLADRYQKVWLGTVKDTEEAKRFKETVHTLVFAMFDDGDMNTTYEKIVDLGLSPDQAAELVRRLLAFTLERSQKEEKLSFRLLNRLFMAGEIDNEIIQQGVQSLYNRIGDLQLDNPYAQEQVDHFVESLKVMKLLDKGFVPDPDAVSPMNKI